MSRFRMTSQERDPQTGEVLHCEKCEQFPAVMETDSGRMLCAECAKAIRDKQKR